MDILFFFLQKTENRKLKTVLGELHWD